MRNDVSRRSPPLSRRRMIQNTVWFLVPQFKNLFSRRGLKRCEDYSDKYLVGRVWIPFLTTLSFRYRPVAAHFFLRIHHSIVQRRFACKKSFRHFVHSFILFSSLLALSTGCSVATPSVTSLLTNLNSFQLTDHDLRIDSLSDLSSVIITASCDMNNTSFEYDISNAVSETWSPVPSTPAGIFTSVAEQCLSTGTFSVVLDLTSTAPYSTMAIGSTFNIKFRDVNLMGLSRTEEFRITYSSFTLSENRLILGQGLNSTRTGTSHTLQGRIINIPQYPTVTGSGGLHTLQGKTVFE